MTIRTRRGDVEVDVPPAANICRGPDGATVEIDAFTVGEELAIGGQPLGGRFTADTVASLYHSIEGRVATRSGDLLELTNGARLRLGPNTVANGAGSKIPDEVNQGDLVQATIWFEPGTNDLAVINIGTSL
jgi:hypothetical protein